MGAQFKSKLSILKLKTLLSFLNFEKITGCNLQSMLELLTECAFSRTCLCQVYFTAKKEVQY